MFFYKQYYSNMKPAETYQESRMICPCCFTRNISEKGMFFARVAETALDLLSGVTKTAWDVLSGVANLCLGCRKWHGMFCHWMFCPAPPLYI